MIYIEPILYPSRVLAKIQKDVILPKYWDGKIYIKPIDQQITPIEIHVHADVIPPNYPGQ